MDECKQIEAESDGEISRPVRAKVHNYRQLPHSWRLRGAIVA